MPKKVIIDAGPLVAFLDAGDEHHEWAAKQFARFPFFETCDAALAEACARLAYAGFDQTKAVRLVSEGAVKLTFNVADNLDRVLALMGKYSDQPMDFADACLVAMSEEQKDAIMITVDRDFRIYRRHGRDRIPLATPYP